MTDAINATERSPTPKWWHVRWKRVGIALVSVFVVLWLITGAFWLVLYQFGSLYSVHSLSQIEPRLSLVPANLPDNTLAPIQGTRFDCLGLSIKEPTSEIRYEKHWGSLCTLSFKNGWIILISDKSKYMDLAQSLRSDASIAKVYGGETLSSNYALTAAAMQATPDQVKWWRPRSQNVRISVLLAAKLGNLQNKGALYKLKIGDMQGFQEGEPNSAPYQVRINLFNSADHQYEITFLTRGEDGPVLTQAEINAVVASIKPVSTK